VGNHNKESKRKDRSEGIHEMTYAKPHKEKIGICDKIEKEKDPSIQLAFSF